MELQNVGTVLRNIRQIYQRREAQLFALAQFYQAKALQALQTRQGFGIGTPGAYWTNQTGQAIARVFGEAIKDRDSIGWFLAHGVDYGVYLELANNRKYESIRPIVEEFAEDFIRDARRLMSD